jgi:hypothetical protein
MERAAAAPASTPVPEGANRQAQARYYETAAGNVDPTLGIVKSLIS